jgi:transposase InsO family protein
MDLDAARQQGAPLEEACAVVGIGLRTYRRWKAGGEDGRPLAERPLPAHALSEAEREAIVDVCNTGRFASLPPSQIVPRLADEGCYLGSESSFYRVLHARGLQHHRGRARVAQRREPPTHEARGPNQVWCWDVSYLPSGIRGLYYYLYLVLDLYSRKVVAWEVHAQECGEHAAALLSRAVLLEGVGRQRQPLVLHADNGAPMKSATLLETLRLLGVQPSHSRPRVSGFYPVSTDSLVKTENSLSRRATLRRIRGLWNRSR